MTDPTGPARPRETDPKPYRPLDPEWAAQRPATDWDAKQQLADLVKAAQREGIPHEIREVDIRMTDGELAVLVLGVSEVSTKAQREHAREVLHGYVSQAFDAIAEKVIHGDRDV